MYTSDIHASDHYLVSMLRTAEKKKCDALIVGGDIIPHYLPNTKRFGILTTQEIYLTQNFIPAFRIFRREMGIPVYLDFANDDFACNRGILEACDGELFHLLHMRKHRLARGVDIMGYMNVPITPFWRKDWEKPDTADQPCVPGNAVTLNGEISFNGKQKKIRINPKSGDTIESDLARLSDSIEGPFIFVSHSPPYATPLDLLHEGIHVGSLAVRRFIEKWSAKGLLMASFHGHIHESPKMSGSTSVKIGNTLCMNPGQGEEDPAGFRYAVFELETEQNPPQVRIVCEPGV